MQAEDRGNIVEHTLTDHQGGSAGDFLRRLKKQFHRAGKLRDIFLQHPGHATEHGGVAVVTAGMHAAGNLRSIRQPGFLPDRKRVDIRPQRHRAGPVALDRGDEPGALRVTALHGDATGLEKLRHAPGRPLLLEADLGMRVQFATQRDEFREVAGDGVGKTGVHERGGGCPAAG